MVVDWDADSAIYKLAFRNDGKLLEQAKSELDAYVAKMYRKFNPEEFNVWITTDESLRKQLYPDYKSKRQPRPEYHHELREHLISKHDAVYGPKGLEADDVLGDRGWQFYMDGVSEYLMVSIDKDLNTIPGNHYNPDKDVMYYVSPKDAYMWLMCQMVIGDTTDTIGGVFRKGVAWCRDNLSYDMSDRQVESAVKHLYLDWKRGDKTAAKAEYDKNMFLLELGNKDPDMLSQ